MLNWLSTLRDPYGAGLLGPDTSAPQSSGKDDWEFDLLKLMTSGGNGASVEQHVISVLSQKRSNTCVANAWEQALRIERKIAGMPTELGSRLFGYSNARAMHNSKSDTGTYLRTYAAALKKVGNCAESDWPFVLGRVNRTPPARCFRNAWPHRGIRGYYKIFDQRYGRTAAVRAALDAKKPVVFGTAIDKAFKKDTPSHIVGVPRGAITGGHAMCIVGYKPDDSGDYLYRVVNSWGRSWQDNGYAWFTEEFVQWLGFQDLWVVSLH